MKEEQKSKSKTKRAEGKKHIGLYVQSQLYEALQKKAKKCTRNNKSEIILRALEAFLEDELKEIANQSPQK